MDVAVKREAFDKFGVSKLTLTDSSCLATSNETHYLIRAPLVGCGTLSRHNSDSVVYSNVVINRIGESMVTRAQEFQVGFPILLVIKAHPRLRYLLKYTIKSMLRLSF